MASVQLANNLHLLAMSTFVRKFVRSSVETLKNWVELRPRFARA